MRELKNGQFVLDEFKPTVLTEKSKCVDEMVLVYGYDKTITYCKLSAYMYRYLCGMAYDKELLDAATWYDNKVIELCDRFEERRYESY